MDFRKAAPLIIFLLIIGSAGAADVNNVTISLNFNQDSLYADGSQVSPGVYSTMDYPYIVSDQPAGLVSYGDFQQLEYRNLSDGLVAYYPLDEGTGSLTEDKSPNNNDGDLLKTPLWTEAKVKKGLKFEDDEYVEVNDSSSLDIDESFTWSTWLKLDNKTADSTVFGKSSAYELTVRENDFKIVSWGDDWNPSYSYAENEWHHITVSGNSAGTERKLYIDGEIVAQGGPSYTMDQSNNPLQIGHWPDQDGNGVNGTIDELRIWDRQLNREEIKEIYRYSGQGPAAGDLLRMTSKPADSSFLVPHTAGTRTAIEERESLVNDRTLLGQISPSFNFFMPETPKIRSIYQFNHTVLTEMDSVRGAVDLQVTNKLNEPGVVLELEAE